MIDGAYAEVNPVDIDGSGLTCPCVHPYTVDRHLSLGAISSPPSYGIGGVYNISTPKTIDRPHHPV